jgi:hypothetical protein
VLVFTKTLLRFADAFHKAAAGPGVARVGTHVVSPRSLHIWAVDRTSPSGKARVGPSVSNTPANRETLRSLGVRI